MDIAEPIGSAINLIKPKEITMLVKDIIINAATLIGREDVVDYLKDINQNPSQNTVHTVEVMLRLLNIVVYELANSFIPIVVTENCTVKNGKVLYSDLSYSPRQILKAFDDDGNDKLLAVEHTFAKVANEKNVNLEYSCFPPEATINDSLKYAESDVSKIALCYGLLAEYSISQGCFKDAVMWHDRYADAIFEQVKPKNSFVKRRNWA